MTLTDNNTDIQEDFTSSVNSMPDKLKMPVTSPVQAGQALRESLLQALDSGRLTVGLYEAGQVLETCPEEVMLCILPSVDPTDVTLHIHLTLIEAFCWENGIKMIKVDKSDKLRNILTKEPAHNNNNTVKSERKEGQLDFSCVLMEYPPSECSESDENVLEFYKVTADIFPQPIIELPV